ncbi:hypothetical protein NECID01_2188, partial [Nematocida sp. AWRm77]
ITTFTTLEDEMCKNIMASNRKMYYLYMQQLLSLQEIESTLKNGNDNVFSSRAKLLKTVEALKKENNECTWDTFDSMSSMKKTILDNELKNQATRWINWLIKGEEATIERHSKHQKKIAKFRDTLKKDPSTALLLEGDHPLRVLADDKVFTNSLALAKIKIKTLIGIVASSALPCLLVAFFMDNREYIETLKQWCYSSFDNRAGLIFMAVLTTLGIYVMGSIYFWKNCYCYGSLKQTYSKEEKRTHSNSIWILSLFEIIMIGLYVMNIIIYFKPGTHKFPTEVSLIQAKISDKEDIMLRMCGVTYTMLYISLVVELVLHLLNGFALFRLRYWKNYLTSTLYKSFLIKFISLIVFLCAFKYYHDSIQHLKASLNRVLISSAQSTTLQIE